MTARLSVLIPVYWKESPEFLGQCLASLASQRRSADEIVLVEDGPIGEGLKAVIGGFRTDLPIVPLPLNPHTGLGTALRAGLNVCGGEYVARMDADDICVPERFQLQLEYLERNPQVDVVGSAIAEFDRDANVPHSIRRLPASGAALRRFAKSRNPLNHMTVMFRRASVIAAGNYECCPGLEDYHLWARMLALGYRIENIDQVLVYARTGNGMAIRRGGFGYLRQEVAFQGFLRRMGLVSALGSFRNILVRVPVRLVPSSIRSLCYSFLLRDRVPAGGLVAG